MPNAFTLWRSSWHQRIAPIEASFFPPRGLVQSACSDWGKGESVKTRYSVESLGTEREVETPCASQMLRLRAQKMEKPGV